ncbi:MAG: hypothetical protein GY847_04895 [Proteobacteria bacterium]|nr:hypothetical protein [Pseudomonadota bacterium]
MLEVPFEGSVVVPFSIAYNGTTCEAAGVETVQAVLDDGAYKAEVDCTDYEILFEGVEAGDHSLALYGLNADGVPIADSLGDGMQEISVVEFEVTVFAAPVTLTEAPVKVLMRWNLGYGTCDSVGFGNFEVKVIAPSGKRIFRTRKLACNAQITELGDYRVVPDPKRKLVNPDIDLIMLQPVDKKGRPLGEEFEVEFTDFVVPGPGESIQLSFRCSAWGCTLPDDSCNKT